MSLCTRLFVAICSALLPPIPAEGKRNYYRVLGVLACSSTLEDDICKAYQQKSLALHLDKVAQCQQANAKAADTEYLEYLYMQEAYAILMDWNNGPFIMPLDYHHASIIFGQISNI